MTALAETLAGCAREVLATAGGGTLHIAGLDSAGAPGSGAVDCPDVVLYDDGGVPTFVGRPGTPVVAAALLNRAAVLSVHTPSGEFAGTSVVLAGRLTATGRESIGDAELVVVALRVSTVLVEREDAAGTPVSQIEIPLPAYRDAAPDPLIQAARRIIRHTNACHGAQLRRFVADLRGIAPGAVAAAELAEVDATGLVLGWVDHRGSHTARFVFPVRADDPDALADRVRDTLVGASS